MLLAPASLVDAAASGAGGVPAGLFYSTDTQPGFRRRSTGKGFVFLDTAGRKITDAKQLARINKLAIPPAYSDVWICASPDGHLQATGRDARGRKQYRYHELWREERDSGKFERLAAFAKVLPAVRHKVRKLLAGRHHTRERVLATIVHLLDTTLVRVGNEEYAKENGSFGLTTLRNRHARLEKGRLKLVFRGKSGVNHEVEVKDPRVAKIVRHCLHLPGQDLFQWADDQGVLHGVTSSDVNDFLNELCGERFTAKDFRTWHGSALALDTICRLCKGPGSFALKQLLAEVSHRLGNTPAVCRKAYIHPQVLSLGMRLSKDKRDAEIAHGVPDGKRARGLTAAERRLVAFLANSH